jgi:hypothetical protein
MAALLAGLSALIALLMALALVDQWRERRRPYQALWAFGSLLFAIAAGTEAIGGVAGWSAALFRTWYLTGAVLNVAWLGLGTAYLLARTRFGYAFALCVAGAGLITIATQRAHGYPNVGDVPLLYLIGALVTAVAIAALSYFQSDRWPAPAAIGIVVVSLVATVLVVTAPLPPGDVALDAHGVPVLDPLPGTLRLATPLMNVTGGFSLIVGALFSAYVFMPKKRVLDYSLDPGQSGDQFLFNLLIAPVAIVVNLVASIPGAVVALFRGRLHSRVPATLLIAVGALLISGTDFGVKGGATTIFELSKLIGIGLIFLGFLVSIEAFRDIRIPFTSIRLTRERSERGSEG